MRTAALTYTDDSYAVGTAFPLVRGWLQECHEFAPADITSRIGCIKMNQLSRGGKEQVFRGQAELKRLLHDIADWACTASGRPDPHIYSPTDPWPLKEILTRSGIFCRWYTSTDIETSSQPDGPTVQLRDIDFENTLSLMAALKASLRGAPGDEGRTDALRLILRNSYVAECNSRLLTNEYCIQQRLLLWSLRRELSKATGDSLHALLVTDTEATSMAVQDPVSSSDAVVEAAEQPSPQDTPAASAIEPTEDLTAPAEDGLPPEPLPVRFSDSERRVKYPHAGEYVVVHTNRQHIFLKSPLHAGQRPTHWTSSASLVLEFRGRGWLQPITVLTTPLRNAEVATGEAAQSAGPIQVEIVAARLADGSWQAFHRDE